jgi:hypothetical protein
MWVAETGWHPGQTWIPRDPAYGTDAGATTSETDGPMPTTLAFVPAETSFGDAFGIDLDAVNGRPVEEGETLEVRSTTVASVGNALFEFEFTDGYDALFTEGRPAALGGAIFKLGVLSTPSPSAAGFDANPLVGMDSQALLEDGNMRNFLGDLGISDGESVQWVSGPDRLPVDGYLEIDGELAANLPDGLNTAPPTLLGNEAPIESFAGVISGKNGPWAVGIHLSRATPDDHVIVAGIQRTPLSTVGGRSGSADNATSNLFPIITWLNWYRDARALMRVTVDRLTPSDA